MTGHPAGEAGTLVPPQVRATLAQKVVLAAVVGGLLVAAAGVVWLLRFLVAPAVVAVVFVYVLGPLVDALENRGLSRSTAVMAAFAVLAGGLITVLIGTWPSLESWLREAPSGGERSLFEQQLEQRLTGWQVTLVERYPHLDWSGYFDSLRHLLQSQRRALVEGLPALVLGLLSHAGSAVMSLVMAFFVLLDGARMKKGLVAMMPNRHFENTLIMLHRVDRQISSYLVGTTVENGLVTVLLAVPLALLGMPNAFLFALIFGVANVIPFAGPVIGAGAGMLFSLLDPAAPSLGALAAVYFVVHLVDAMLISPLVMGKSLNMHPLTVILGIFVGGTLGGVVGMLVVIPVIAVSKAVITTVVEGVRNARAG